MKKSLFVVAVMIVSVSLLLTVGAERAGAQGPAGAGASTAAKGGSNSSGSNSSHSLNPIKWGSNEERRATGQGRSQESRRVRPKPEKDLVDVGSILRRRPKKLRKLKKGEGR